ncbi:MAG: hypothetical protein DMD47_07015 [Gemmatimonadetes bacterium]|nr:MAG: hypothetical protein DMD47_07015 [Gemmatimonadota bacterium]
MTSSASSPISLAIAGYVAGRVGPGRLVALVSAAYYGDGGTLKDSLPVGGTRDGLKPLMDVIERAAPGVVELAGRAGGAGFDIRLAERPFPKRYEAELRRAAETYLQREEAGEEVGEGGTLKDSLTVGGKGDGLFGRALQAIRRLFSASA